MQTDCDVCVVGGGLVGVTTACLLAKQGISVTLLEHGEFGEWDAQSISPRVSAINLASKNLLTYLGVWQSIAASRASPYSTMQVWDTDSRAFIRFEARDFSLTQLGYIVENPLMVQQMHARLRQNYHVRIIERAEVKGFKTMPNAIRLTLSRVGQEPATTLSTRLLIAADGGRSAIREMAAIATEEQDFNQLAMVTTVRCENSHQNTAWQCFTPGGPIALLPLHDRYCALVWSLDRPRAESMLDQDLSTVANRLEAHFADYLGKLELLQPLQSFPLVHRHAKRYIQQQLALVGDAAHTTHPLAGLGANIGLQDAAALSEVICDAKTRGQPFYRQSVLRRYERWRRGGKPVGTKRHERISFRVRSIRYSGPGTTGDRIFPDQPYRAP